MEKGVVGPGIKMSRGIIFTLALVALLLMVVPAGAMAGTEENPEVMDDTGDSTTGEGFHDILKVWVGEETESEISIFMKVSGNPKSVSVGDFIDMQDEPIYNFEVYFRCMGTEYGISAKTQVAARLFGQIDYVTLGSQELYIVEYESETSPNIQNETR